MKKKRLLLVDWVDISCDNSWHYEDELGDCVPLACQTVGWEMKSDKNILRISPTRCETNNKCTDIWAIPRDNIKKIKVLK